MLFYPRCLSMLLTFAWLANPSMSFAAAIVDCTPQEAAPTTFNNQALNLPALSSCLPRLLIPAHQWVTKTFSALLRAPSSKESEEEQTQAIEEKLRLLYNTISAIQLLHERQGRADQSYLTEFLGQAIAHVERQDWPSAEMALVSQIKAYDVQDAAWIHSYPYITQMIEVLNRVEKKRISSFEGFQSKPSPSKNLDRSSLFDSPTTLDMAYLLREDFEQQTDFTQMINQKDLKIITSYFRDQISLNQAVHDIASISERQSAILMIAGRLSLQHLLSTVGRRTIIDFLSSEQSDERAQALAPHITRQETYILGTEEALEILNTAKRLYASTYLQKGRVGAWERLAEPTTPPVFDLYGEWTFEGHTLAFGDRTIEFVEGDLSTIHADGIAVPSTPDLDWPDGVGKSILDAAGVTTTRAINNLRHDSRLMPGTAFDVPAGRLHASNLLLAIVSDHHHHADPDVVRAATRRVLNLADHRQFHRLALPSFGTGSLGISYQESAEIAVSELASHLSRPTTSVNHVIVVLWGKKAYDTYIAQALAFTGVLNYETLIAKPDALSRDRMIEGKIQKALIFFQTMERSVHLGRRLLWNFGIPEQVIEFSRMDEPRLKRGFATIVETAGLDDEHVLRRLLELSNDPNPTVADAAKKALATLTLPTDHSGFHTTTTDSAA